MKKAIFLFDVTGITAQPWLDAGYECWCFDGQHPRGVTREGNHVKVGMFFEANAKLLYARRITETVGEGVEFVFGFPECTDLTNAGARHFNAKRTFNSMFQLEATELADLVRVVGVLYGCRWGFENPNGVLSTQYRAYDFRFDPCDFGGGTYQMMTVTQCTRMCTRRRMPTTRVRASGAVADSRSQSADVSSLRSKITPDGNFAAVSPPKLKIYAQPPPAVSP